MRPAYFMLALAMTACSISASAADVDFEVRSDVFEHPAELVKNFAEATYDHPLYEGLWPMTLKAFRQLDMPRDKEFFTLCIAANN